MAAAIAGHVAFMYLILIGVNLPAPLLGLRFEDGPPAERLWFEPPGYVIPIAWFVLFALLGYAHYLVTRPPASGGRWPVVGLAVVCAAYAYYTIGLANLTGISALWFGLAGNLIVIGLALLVALRISRDSPTAALAVVPVAGWTVFATAIVIGQLLSNFKEA